MPFFVDKTPFSAYCALAENGQYCDFKSERVLISVLMKSPQIKNKSIFTEAKYLFYMLFKVLGNFVGQSN